MGNGRGLGLADEDVGSPLAQVPGGDGLGQGSTEENTLIHDVSQEGGPRVLNRLVRPCGGSRIKRMSRARQAAPAASGRTFC